MRVFGVDFTSRPGPRKPIVVAAARLDGGTLLVEAIESLTGFTVFERWLATPGPWIGGFDFPFGLPRHFVTNACDARDWPALIDWLRSFDREGFCAVTWPAFRAARGLPAHKHRAVDAAAGSHSPLKTMDPVRRVTVNPPVGLMFFEGAPRLAAAGLHLPGLRENADARVALEAYPGFAARVLGVRHYKNDPPGDRARPKARAHVLAALAEGRLHGIALELARGLRAGIVADVAGDRLDAVLCAMQAAWAAQRRATGYGLPARIDPLEGWIVTVPNA